MARRHIWFIRNHYLSQFWSCLANDICGTRSAINQTNRTNQTRKLTNIGDTYIWVMNTNPNLLPRYTYCTMVDYPRINMQLSFIYLSSTLLTHWGRVTHICVTKLTTIGPVNKLLHVRRQTITWTSAGLLSTGPLRTNFSVIKIQLPTFSLKKCIRKCRMENGGHFDSMC